MAIRLPFSQQTMIISVVALATSLALYWWATLPQTWDGSFEFTVSGERDGVVAIMSVEGTALGDGQPLWGGVPHEGITVQRARQELPFPVGTRVWCQVHQRIADEFADFRGVPDIHVGQCTTTPAARAVVS